MRGIICPGPSSPRPPGRKRPVCREKEARSTGLVVRRLQKYVLFYQDCAIITYGITKIAYLAVEVVRVKGRMLMLFRLRFIALAGVLVLAMWALAGCGGSSSGTGRLQVRLIDAPLAADAVNVSIASVQIHKAGGGWQTVKEFDPPLEVNLLQYASGQSLLLADEPLGAGHYTMVRIFLSSAEVVIGSDTYPVDLTNVEQTGVKCNGQFTVETGQLLALTLDFNAGRSFVDTGGGMYSLHPVMTMAPDLDAAQANGIVQFEGLTAVPDGVTVNLYTIDHPGEEDFLIASADVSTVDGSFEFGLVAQGTYDLQVYRGTTAVTTVEDEVITAPTTDLGTITVPASP